MSRARRKRIHSRRPGCAAVAQLRVAPPPRDPEVCELLAGLLERAERGEVQGVAVAVELDGGRTSTAWAGAPSHGLAYSTFELVCRLRDAKKGDA
jgi:hypothetical protein